MIYQVCYNAAGCLPDSESYPYSVDGIDAAIDALRAELACEDDSISQANILSACQTLQREDAVYVPLQGTYALTIEGQGR